MMDLKERCEEMREFFDEKASSIDDVHGPMMANKDAITEVLPDGTENILDLGAGTGMELITLFGRFPGCHVTALDISQNMLDRLMERPFASHLTPLCGDFFTVDFGTGYDAVISSAALHHFEEEPKALLYKKAFGCLRPGGLFINSDRCFETYKEQLDWFADFETNRTLMRHCDTPLAIEREKLLLENAGFTDFTCRTLDDNLYRLITVRKPL